MYDFTYTKPTTQAEVVRLLDRHGDDASLIAGGAFFTIAMKLGLVGANTLVSLQNVDSLRQITVAQDGSLRIGALVKHREIELSDMLQEHWPLLPMTYGKVANVRIRNQSTVGGNLVTADYASDPPSALMALQANVRLVSNRGERVIPVRELIVGHYATSKEPDELLTEVIVPPMGEGARATYLKYKSRSHEDRPCASVAAVLWVDADDVCTDLRVAIGAAAEKPHIQDEALALAIGRPLDAQIIEQIADAYADTIDPIDDLRGSAWYRREISRVLVSDALSDLAGLEQATP